MRKASPEVTERKTAHRSLDMTQPPPREKENVNIVLQKYENLVYDQNQGADTTVVPCYNEVNNVKTI